LSIALGDFHVYPHVYAWRFSCGAEPPCVSMLVDEGDRFLRSRLGIGEVGPRRGRECRMLTRSNASWQRMAPPHWLALREYV
jgi:hypothetical protein